MAVSTIATTGVRTALDPIYQLPENAPASSIKQALDKVRKLLEVMGIERDAAVFSETAQRLSQDVESIDNPGTRSELTASTYETCAELDEQVKELHTTLDSKEATQSAKYLQQELTRIRNYMARLSRDLNRVSESISNAVSNALEAGAEEARRVRTEKRLVETREISKGRKTLLSVDDESAGNLVVEVEDSEESKEKYREQLEARARELAAKHRDVEDPYIAAIIAREDLKQYVAIQDATGNWGAKDKKIFIKQYRRNFRKDTILGSGQNLYEDLVDGAVSFREGAKRALLVGIPVGTYNYITTTAVRLHRRAREKNKAYKKFLEFFSRAGGILMDQVINRVKEFVKDVQTAVKASRAYKVASRVGRAGGRFGNTVIVRPAKGLAGIGINVVKTGTGVVRGGVGVVRTSGQFLGGGIKGGGIAAGMLLLSGSNPLTLTVIAPAAVTSGAINATKEFLMSEKPLVNMRRFLYSPGMKAMKKLPVVKQLRNVTAVGLKFWKNKNGSLKHWGIRAKGAVAAGKAVPPRFRPVAIGFKAAGAAVNGIGIGGFVGFIIAGPAGVVPGMIAGGGLSAGGSVISTKIYNIRSSRLASSKIANLVSKVPLLSFAGAVQSSMILQPGIRVLMDELGMMDKIADYWEKRGDKKRAQAVRNLKPTDLDRTLYWFRPGFWGTVVPTVLWGAGTYGYYRAISPIYTRIAGSGFSRMFQSYFQAQGVKIGQMLPARFGGMGGMARFAAIAPRTVGIASGVGSLIGSAVGFAAATALGLNTGVFAAVGGAVGGMIGAGIGVGISAVVTGVTGGIGVVASGAIITVTSAIGSFVGTMAGAVIDTQMNKLIPTPLNPLVLYQGLLDVFKFFNTPITKLEDYATIGLSILGIINLILLLANYTGSGNFDSASGGIAAERNIQLEAASVEYSEDYSTLYINSSATEEYTISGFQSMEELANGSIVLIDNSDYWVISNLGEYQVDRETMTLKGTNAQVSAEVYMKNDSQDLAVAGDTEDINGQGFIKVDYCRIYANLCY
jgi:hypothetical protein